MAAEMSSDKPTLVLLHGWGVNQGVWQQVAGRLSPHVKVITLDLPGFGLNRHYPQPYSLSAVTAQLAADIPPDSYVCGWSLGGLLGIALARHYPQQVKQLALVAASPCFMAAPGWPGMAEGLMQQFAQSLADNLPLTIERFLAIQAMGSESARRDIKVLKQAVMAYPMAAPEAIAGALALLQQDLRPEFAALTQPVQGLYGRLDTLVPAALVPQLQHLHPAGQFDIAAKASHAPFISHPEQFIDWVSHWLGLDSVQTSSASAD